MASFFYFNSLSSWKWTFPEGLGGLCHTCGNSEGVGGHQFPAKMENPGRWGGPKWNSLRGGGLDIFWNYTFRKTCQVTLSDHFNTVDFQKAECYLRRFSLIRLNSGLRIEEQLLSEIRLTHLERSLNQISDYCFYNIVPTTTKPTFNIIMTS